MFALAMILPLLAVAAPQMIDVGPQEHLAVLDEGPAGGTPVVLIPGLSGCAYGFRNLVPLLHEQGFRTITIEPLGLGLSDRTGDADYTLTRQAERLGQVLDRLGIKGALVVSQGVATSMVLRLTLDRSELVYGLVSVEGGAAEEAATSGVRRSLKLAKLAAKLGGSRYLRDRYADDLRKASGDDTWVDKRTVRQYFRGPSQDIHGTLCAFLAMTNQPEPEALAPRLGDLGIPVLVLHGGAKHEGALEPEELEILENQLNDVEIRVVPGAGHFIYEEQPTVVAQAVADLQAKVNR